MNDLKYFNSKLENYAQVYIFIISPYFNYLILFSSNFFPAFLFKISQKNIYITNLKNKHYKNIVRIINKKRFLI